MSLSSNEYNYDCFINAISVLSFFLGLENLAENRQQSAHNDVQAANQSQASYLLDELAKKFDEQNEMLEEILDKIKDM